MTVIDTTPVVVDQAEPAPTAAPNRALVYRIIGGGLGATLLTLAALLTLGQTTAAPNTTTPAALATVTTNTEGTTTS